MGEIKPPPFAWIILLCSVCAVSSAGAVFQLIDQVPPILRASWRLQATSLLLLPPFLFQIWQLKKTKPESYEKLKDKSIISYIIFSGCCLWIHFGSWVWSLDHTSLTHSLLFVTAHPLVIVAGLYLFGKGITAKQTSGALIGFIGACITLLGVTNEGDVTLIGDFAAFIGAVAFVGYLSVGRLLRENMPLFIYAFPVTLLASILLSITSLLFEGASIDLLPSDISVFGWNDILWLPAIAYLAIVPGIIGHTGINGVLRWFPPIFISVSVLFEPLLGSVIGWVLGTTDIPGFYTWIGGPFLLMGIVLVTLGQTELDSEKIIAIDSEE